MQPSIKKYTGRCAAQNVYRRHISKVCVNNGSETLIPRVPPPTASPAGFGRKSMGRENETKVTREGGRARRQKILKSPQGACDELFSVCRAR